MTPTLGAAVAKECLIDPFYLRGVMGMTNLHDIVRNDFYIMSSYRHDLLSCVRYGSGEELHK